MSKTLIKNGKVVSTTGTIAQDVLIDGETITALAAPGYFTEEGADTVIDASGKYVIPGGIDVHTHMELPFGGTTASDDFDTGTVAAAHGGTTTIVDFAIQSKGSSMRAGLDAWHAKSEGKAAIDYGFHMIMTEANPSTLEDMAAMVREGVTSFKMFMAYPGVFLVDDQQIFRAMQRYEAKGDDTNALAAFSREAELLRQLAHPAIPRLRTSFQEGSGADARGDDSPQRFGAGWPMQVEESQCRRPTL